MMESQEYKYMVRVSCMTFNQSQYITDAMNGFVMQQTNFPFVVTIVDDASTDGEQDVIKAYMNEHFDVNDTKVAYEKETDYAYITYAQHKTNKNCYFAVLYLKENHYSQRKPKAPYITEWNNVKYIAICEGDDYWIHPQKLQMQVDFLEKKSDATLCFHAYATLNDKTKEMDDVFRYSSDLFDVPAKDMILGGGGFMATNSMLYPINAIKEYPTWASTAPIGDLPLMLVLLHRGRVCYINKNMSVYRTNAQGSWTEKNATNFSRQKRNHYGVNKMWHEFDKWAKYDFHNIVKKKLYKNKKQYIKAYILNILNSLK